MKIQEESSISTCIVQEVDVTTPRLCCIEKEKKADSLWKAYRPISGRLLLCNNNKDNNSDNNDVINKVTNLNLICYLTILWSQNYNTSHDSFTKTTSELNISLAGILNF